MTPFVSRPSSPRRGTIACGLACRAIALLVAACGPALAQPDAAPPAPDAPYPLRAAVADALLRNPAVAVAGSDRAAAGYLREAAEWGRFPTLSAEVAPGVASGGTGSGSSRIVRLEQPLWTGGRIEGQIDAARAQERASQLGEFESRRSLTEQTAVVYLGWVGADQRLQIAVDGRALFERLLAYVERRQAAGAAALSDVSVARARLSAALAQNEQLRGELDRSRAELQALVVGPAGRPVAATVPTFVPLATGTARAASAAAVASAAATGDATNMTSPAIGATTTSPTTAASTTSPTAASSAYAADAIERSYLDKSNLVAQRLADVDAARAAVAVRRGQLLPTLSLRIENQQSNGSSGNAPSQSRALLALQFTTEPGLAGLSAANAAESKLLTAQEQVRGTEVDVRLRARTHFSDQQSALRQLADLQPQIADLQSTADSYLRQFEAGRKSWLEVLNVYREVLDTRLAVSRAETLRDQSNLHLMGNTGALTSWIDNTPP